MVSVVVTATVGIGVVPLFVVDGNPHFRWITVIQVGTGSVIFISPEVLWVIDIGIVIETFPVRIPVSSTPDASVSAVRCLRFYKTPQNRIH